MIGTLFADRAYDGIENHRFMQTVGVRFVPNLNPRFGKKPDLDKRDELLAQEEELGKTGFHKVSGYNRRWLIEAFFSVFKRPYGEKISNRLFSRTILRLHNGASLKITEIGWFHQSHIKGKTIICGSTIVMV